MESIETYFWFYEPFPLIICVVAFIALIIWRSKVNKKQSASKPKLTFIASLVFVVCHFIYFQYQHNTPHSLFYEYKGTASVDLDQIVFAEIDTVYDRYWERHSRWLKFTLKNGKELKWNLDRVAVRSRSAEIIHWHPEETLNLEF